MIVLLLCLRCSFNAWFHIQSPCLLFWESHGGMKQAPNKMDLEADPKHTYGPLTRQNELRLGGLVSYLGSPSEDGGFSEHFEKRCSD